MITIRPILKKEIPAAKQLIMTVAYGIFGWNGSLEESIQFFESSGEYMDMDNIQSHYFDNCGMFLGAFDGDKLIGTGAVRKMDSTTAELKRLWLMELYQGRRIGFQLITTLFDFARSRGYQTVRLQTSPQQTRAIGFYKKVGFFKIPSYNCDTEAVSMEISLVETK